jgi:hypothetical protein
MHKIKLGTEFGSNSEKPFNNSLSLNRQDNKKGRLKQGCNPTLGEDYGESKKLPYPFVVVLFWIFERWSIWLS